jgi:hypothetical protein
VVFRVIMTSILVKNSGFAKHTGARCEPSKAASAVIAAEIDLISQLRLPLVGLPGNAFADEPRAELLQTL